MYTPYTPGWPQLLPHITIPATVKTVGFPVLQFSGAPPSCCKTIRKTLEDELFLVLTIESNCKRFNSTVFFRWMCRYYLSSRENLYDLECDDSRLTNRNRDEEKYLSFYLLKWFISKNMSPIIFVHSHCIPSH